MNMILILLSIVVILSIYLLKRNYEYWKDRKVYHHKPKFPFGNAGDIFKQTSSFGSKYNELYTEAKYHKQPHAGFYFCLSPQYVPTDINIIKSILLKDFNSFHDRGVYYNERDDPLSAHLFTIDGMKWRRLRAKISPTFTAGKIKLMFQTVVKITDELIEVMRTLENPKGIEIKDLLARLTTDIIGDCAFGLECNSLKNPNAEFRWMGKAIFYLTPLQQFVQSLTFVFPNICRFFGVRQQNRNVTNFFMKVIKDTVKLREEKSLKRNDFINLMLELNRDRIRNDEKPLTIEEIAAQSFVFFVGGFETSSTTMSFCLYELCRHLEIQEKLRREIFDVFEKYGELSYEALQHMPYMDMVINETLRKYPVLPLLNRICTFDFKVPGTDLILEEGTQIAIPVEGIHYDEEYYPNPKKFNPERFNKEEKKKRPAFTFLSFGEGPRICIGMRFGFLQTKVGLTLLLRHFRFTLNQKTPVPLIFDKKQFIKTVLGGIFIDIEAVNPKINNNG